MSATAKLSSANSPLALFSQAFDEHFVKPRLEANDRMRNEHEQRKLAVIRALDRERSRQQFEHDCREGLLTKI